MLPAAEPWPERQNPSDAGGRAGIILVLNGASGSGKTAIARALQERWGRPLLHLGTDAMLALLPAALVGMKPSATEGIEFLNDTDARGPIVRVRRGEVGRQLEESFASAVRALADGGHDVLEGS